MNAKEKMLSGQLHIPDAELIAERVKAQKLMHKYNAINPANIAKRTKFLQKWFGAVGKKCFIEQPFYCDYGSNITLGDRVFTNVNVTILDCAKVKIGNDVWIAPNVGIYTATHPTDPEQRRQKLEYAKPIKIGNNVWIGGGASILPGVTIGDNSVIGAGSVVNKDIPANVVAVGNPCRVIKKL